MIYGLDCPYYRKSFKTINKLINDVIETGMDPNYEITRYGIGIGEKAIDFIVE